jgi:hypothetical protein
MLGAVLAEESGREAEAYHCEAKDLFTTPGVVRPPKLAAYPSPRGQIHLLFVGWNPPTTYGGFWSLEEPDNLRRELHGILREIERVRSEEPAAAFLDEFLETGHYFVHSVKCWTSARYPGFGRKAVRRDRHEIGEPLLRACAAAHLETELSNLQPASICALGELAYVAIRCLDPGLPASARPSEGQIFTPASDGTRWRLLYTCFPSGNFVHGSAARDITRKHLESFTPDSRQGGPVS